MSKDLNINKIFIKSKLLLWKTNMIKDNVNKSLRTPILSPSYPDISNPSSFDLDSNDNMIIKRNSSLDSYLSLFDY